MRATVLKLLPSKILKNLCFCIWAFIFSILVFSCNTHDDDDFDVKAEKLLEKGAAPNLSNEARLQYLDSASVELGNYKNDSLTRLLYRQCIVDYYRFNEYDKAIALSRKVLKLAKAKDDSLSIGKASYFSGLSYYQKSSVDSALHYYRDAEKIFKKLNSPDLGSVLLYKSYVFHDVGEYVLCESEASEALKLLQEQHKNYEVFQCFVVIGLALNDQDNTDDAIYYYKQALDQAEKFREDGYTSETIESYRVGCYNNIGLVYEKKGLYDDAIAQYQKSLQSPSTEKKSVSYAKIINNIANVKLQRGDRGGVKNLFFEALHISDSLNNKPGIVSGNLSLGNYYVAEKDTTQAIGYFKKAYNGAKQINSNSDRLTSLKELAGLDIKNSLKYSKEYIKLDDSLQKVSLKNRNKFARIEYETDQLKDEKNALAKKNSFIIGVSVLVLLFVAAVFIIYYLNSRNKELLHVQDQQKANEEIYQLMFEQQGRIENARAEEKNRIAMELHDGILNNIYAVRLNLEFSNRKNDEDTILKRKHFIKELQGVESEIRAVSHDLSRSAQFIQGKDFAAMLEFMVTTQKNNFETEFDISIDKGIDWDAVPNTHKINIYRIIQEALQNVNKYAKASHAQVEVKTEGRHLTVIVQDNGVGFDTRKAAAGIGIKNLKKRSEALNGLLEIDSEEGKGSSVKVQFALR